MVEPATRGEEWTNTKHNIMLASQYHLNLMGTPAPVTLHDWSTPSGPIPSNQPKPQAVHYPITKWEFPNLNFVISNDETNVFGTPQFSEIT